MMKYILITLLLFGNVVLAQQKYTTTNKLAIRYYEKASSLLDLNNFAEALLELKGAVKADEKFNEAYILTGDVNRVLHEYKTAIDAYTLAYKINPDFAPERYYYLAECELRTGLYQQSLDHYNLYLQKGNPDERKIKLTNKYIEDCKYAIVAVKNPVDFKPVNLGPNINTVYQEYLAALTTDENTLIFTRQINSNEDFYRSYNIKGEWSKAENLGDNINTPAYNEGAQCVSPDGQFLFFTGCNRPDGYGRCDIYVSQKEGKGWSKPVNLGFPINTKGWESQPSLSSDGRTIYFVSDRPGGFGTYDIWKSTLSAEGKWTLPTNLGPSINTSFEEQSPFIHPDNKTLYFSSEGWVGMGNKDLFISRLDSTTGNWLAPKNLGYPINSYGEESGLTINASGTKAFFSSNNYNGFGGYDIYSFNLPKNLRPTSTNYVKGLVYDANTKKPLNALVDIIDLVTGKSLYASYADKIDGSFLVTLPEGKEYSLNVSKEEYLFYSENFSVERYKPGIPITLDVPLYGIEIGNKVILKNIFFDTNKFDLKPKSAVELNKLIEFMEENPGVKIEIQGFTDNVGNDNANQILSDNRSKAVYNYLITKKINAARLSYKGFGKNNPIADNKTVAGRANNRRTEFIIKSK